MFIALRYQWLAGEDDLFDCLDIFSAKLNAGKLEKQELKINAMVGKPRPNKQCKFCNYLLDKSFDGQG